MSRSLDWSPLALDYIYQRSPISEQILMSSSADEKSILVLSLTTPIADTQNGSSSNLCMFGQLPTALRRVPCTLGKRIREVRHSCVCESSLVHFMGRALAVVLAVPLGAGGVYLVQYWAALTQSVT